VADFWGKEEAAKAAQEFERVFKHKKYPTEMEEIKIRATKTPLINLLISQNILEEYI